VYFGINQQPFQENLKPSSCGFSFFLVYRSDIRSESSLMNVSLQNCVILGYYTTNSGKSLPTFRDELSLPFQWSRSETSAMNRHYSLRNSPEERSSYLLRGGNLQCRRMFHLLTTGNQQTVSVCRLKKSNGMQEYVDIYLLLNYSSCFGRPSCPSSGVHKTVVAASGTDHTTWGASFLKRDQIRD